MAAVNIDLRNDFDSVSLRRLAKRTRDATQSRRLLALAEVYGVAAGRMRRGSAASVCRSFATAESCASIPRTAVPTGWSMGSHRAHPRSSTPITAAHWRRLLSRPGPGGRRRRCAGGARTWRGGSWRRSPSRSTTDGTDRARVEGARLRQDLGAAAPLRAGFELAVEAFPGGLKTSPPNWRRSGRGSRKASR